MAIMLNSPWRRILAKILGPQDVTLAAGSMFGSNAPHKDKAVLFYRRVCTNPESALRYIREYLPETVETRSSLPSPGFLLWKSRLV